MAKKQILISDLDIKRSDKIYLLQWHISDYKAAITLQQHIGSKVTQLPYLNLVITWARRCV